MVHGWELRRAIIAKLRAANITHKAPPVSKGGPVRDVPTPIYDRVPKDTARPYIVVGNTTAIPAGTQDDNGQEATITCVAWTQDNFIQGAMMADSILSQINTALVKADIVIPSGVVRSPIDDFQQVFATEGGETYQGVFRLRFFIFSND